MKIQAWIEQRNRDLMLLWLEEVLDRVRFSKSNEHPQLITCWMDQKEDDIFFFLPEVLRVFYGAYACGPLSNVCLPGRCWHFTFGFYTQELLQHALQDFPFPEGTVPGPVPLLAATNAEKEAFRKAYSVSVSQLPRSY